MLTGESSLDVIVKSLYAGANQYITKPYNLDELLARVYAALQTTTDSIQPRTGGNPGSFAVITEHRTLKCDGKSITLTKREWDLWQLLVLQPEIVVSRDHIHRALFNQGYLPFSRAVDIIAGRLRKKLRSLTDEVAILSVRSSGYVLARNRKV